MGKTSFALGMLTHVGAVLKRPALLFSLEMSHLELSQRLLASEARVDAQRMRTGQLGDTDWQKVSRAITRLGQASIFIDDNPHLTVMDVRARARRLKKQHGELGLVVVDYLQLMSSRVRSENRQVEVAEMSRGLKILARELQCPVVALSQLSRGLEARADKRPMLSDLRESGSLDVYKRQGQGRSVGCPRFAAARKSSGCASQTSSRRTLPFRSDSTSRWRTRPYSTTPDRTRSDFGKGRAIAMRVVARGG